MKPQYHTFTEEDMIPGLKIICVYNDLGYCNGDWTGSILTLDSYDAEWHAWHFYGDNDSPSHIRWTLDNLNRNMSGGNIIFWPLDKFTKKELFAWKMTGKLPNET